MSSALILGVLHQLDFPAVRPFLRSLQNTGSSAHVHFFVSGMGSRDLDKIREYGATVEPFFYPAIRRNPVTLLLWPLWRWCLARARTFEARAQLAAYVMHLFGIRWVLYYRYLAERVGEFQRVLVTDVRDVYFQRDPFSMDYSAGLHCYLETAGRTIGQCAYNRRALGMPMGKAAVQELANRPISCAGTTIGDPASLLVYMRTMIDLLSRSRRFYEDQGVHNYVVHHQLVPQIHLHENGVHAVRTVGLERLEDIPQDASGNIIGPDCQITPILHQYDRLPELRNRLLARL